MVRRVPHHPRHGGRTQWNDASLRKACSGGQRLLICHAEDTIKTRPLSLSERYALAARGAGDGRQKRKNLPEVIELVIGMKVMVTSNGYHTWGEASTRGKLHHHTETPSTVCVGQFESHKCRPPRWPRRRHHPDLLGQSSM